MRKLFAIGLSMLIGGLAALFILLIFCFALDLISALSSTVIYSDDSAGRSGDSSFGTSAAPLVIFFGPPAFIFGAFVISISIYYFMFKCPTSQNYSAPLELLLFVVVSCVACAFPAKYLETSFMQGVYWGCVLGIALGAPVVWLRNSMRKA